MARLRLIFKVISLKDNLLSVINLAQKLQIMRVKGISKIKPIK